MNLQIHKGMVFMIPLFWFLTSCSLPRDYTFLVYNNTAFTIHTLYVGDQETSVGPYASSDTVVYHFSGTYLNLAEPQYDLNIFKYSDSDSSYINRTSYSLPIPDLNKKGINVIEIRFLGSTDDTNIFYRPEHVFDLKLKK